MNILNNLDNLSELNIKTITDKNQSNLYLLKYDKVKSDFNNESVLESRGIILEKDTNKVICYGLNKMNTDFNEKNVKWENCKIYEVIDGTQIRLYYYNNEWNVTTARCIDAKKSSWNYIKNFYELYKDVEIDTSKLNTDYTYTFILRHIENRIVSNITKNELIHIHTRNNKTYEEINEKINDVINYKNELHFDNFDDFKKELKNSTFETRGYVIHYENKKYLFETDEYKYVKKLKGNHRNITYQYIDLLKNNKYEEFLEYYPEKKLLFTNAEKELKELSIKVYTLYINKNVKKEIKFNDIPKEFRKLIYNLHSIYIKERTTITPYIVFEYIKRQSPGFVVNLLKTHLKSS